MATKHPYVGGSGRVVKVLDHLRKSFPPTLGIDTLKKLGLAPQNESKILAILRFVNLIDQEDGRTELGHEIFTLHSDSEFEAAFSKAIEAAYQDLFSLHGDGAWQISDEKLIAFFRQSDRASEIVGSQQANTFRTLAAYSGHGTLPAPKVPPSAQPRTAVRRPSQKGKADNTSVKVPTTVTDATGAKHSLSVSVRVEINLPTCDDQETYDRIFKSLRDNLIGT
jgi:hypothetical protein